MAGTGVGVGQPWWPPADLGWLDAGALTRLSAHPWRVLLIHRGTFSISPRGIHTRLDQ